MPKEIRYTPRGYTESNNDYVTIDEDDMGVLMNQIIVTLAKYAELTSTSNGSLIVTNRDKELFGRRGKTSIAPGRANTRLSVLGGVVNNYYTKPAKFKNDISVNQLPYIVTVLNECCDQFGYEPIVFRNNFFNWDE
jgi:hypothetical protein